MGANAQTTVQKFLSGAVLTAEQQNTSAATGVPVFATTVTRDAAFGGANKVLAEGQLAYIEATNVVQFYDGAAWATVGPSGLVVVKAETAFTAIGNVIADNVFTSSYTNYQIRLTGTGVYSAVTLQLRVGGVAATSNYNIQKLSGNSATASAVRTTDAASASIGELSTVNGSTVLDLFGPQLAAQTQFWAQMLHNGDTAITPLVTVVAGNHSTATAYDGLILTFGGDSTGTYTIYGYGKTL